MSRVKIEIKFAFRNGVDSSESDKCEEMIKNDVFQNTGIEIIFDYFSIVTGHRNPTKYKSIASLIVEKRNAMKLRQYLSEKSYNFGNTFLSFSSEAGVEIFNANEYYDQSKLGKFTGLFSSLRKIDLIDEQTKIESDNFKVIRFRPIKRLNIEEVRDKLEKLWVSHNFLYKLHKGKDERIFNIALYDILK